VIDLNVNFCWFPEMSNQSQGYVVYIDEAGDPGLTRVRPIDENGASDWIVLRAVLSQTCVREIWLVGSIPSL